MPILVLENEDGNRKHFQFDRNSITMGRDSNNTLQLKDRKTSRVHCKIEKTEDGYRILDLDSQNGTRVNGEQVKEGYLLSGDRIEIGDTEFIFQEEGREEGSEKTETRVETEAVDHSGSNAFGRGETKRITRDNGRKENRTRTSDDGFDEEKWSRYESELKEYIEDLLEDLGKDSLDFVADVLDDYYESLTGSPRIEGLEHTRDRLLSLQETIRQMNSEHNLQRVLEMIMDTAVALTGAERGFLILVEDDEMNFRVARNYDRKGIDDPEFQISHSIAGKVIDTGDPVLTSNAADDRRFNSYMSVNDLNLRSVLCLPFSIKDQVLGCVYLDNRFETGLFTESDQTILEPFMDQAAVAIENARLLQKNKRKNEELRESKEKVEELNEKLKERVEEQSLELEEVKQKLQATRREMELTYDYENIVAESRAMRQVLQTIDGVVDTDLPVLIQGESGTGKELIARAIHFNGNRKEENFTSVNCSAIPESLLESELFGHVKGAFTGAKSDKRGFFEVADEGTLLLDEIGDMPRSMQAKLLRVLEEEEIRRVGGEEKIPVNVRVISATNKDLTELIEKNEFREDLYYRLNVVSVHLPPLRERPKDIPYLARHFLQREADKMNVEPPKIEEDAMELLVGWEWPGNVRELENEIKRIAALCAGSERITAEDIKEPIRKEGKARSFEFGTDLNLKETVRQVTRRVERELITEAMEQTDGVKSHAANVLGISRPTLNSKLKEYDIEWSKE